MRVNDDDLFLPPFCISTEIRPHVLCVTVAAACIGESELFSLPLNRNPVHITTV